MSKKLKTKQNSTNYRNSLEFQQYEDQQKKSSRSQFTVKKKILQQIKNSSQIKNIKDYQSPKKARNQIFSIFSKQKVVIGCKNKRQSNLGYIVSANQRISTLKNRNKNSYFEDILLNDQNHFQMFLDVSSNQIGQKSKNNILNLNMRPLNGKFIRELNFKQKQKIRHNKSKMQNAKSKIDKSKEPIFQPKSISLKQSSQKFNNKTNFSQLNHMAQRQNRIQKNEMIHGETQITYMNGAKFQGLYQNGIRLYGKFNFSNGYIYDGEFQGDWLNGNGQLRTPGGKVYTGNWVKNKLIGKAQIKYPSQDLYYGQVEHFKKHGHGQVIFKNGDKYIGQFSEGLITGKGQYFSNNICIGRGTWKNGQLIEKMSQALFQKYLQASQISSNQNTQQSQTRSAVINKRCFNQLNNFYSICQNPNQQQSSSFEQQFNEDDIKQKQKQDCFQHEVDNSSSKKVYQQNKTQQKNHP